VTSPARTPHEHVRHGSARLLAVIRPSLGPGQGDRCDTDGASVVQDPGSTLWSCWGSSLVDVANGRNRPCPIC
jgi:hypothetical protein